MDFNFLTNQFRDLLTHLHLSFLSLALFGSFFLIIGVWSLREMLGWFLNVPALQKELEVLRQRLEKLEQDLSEGTFEAQLPDSEKPVREPAAANSKTLQFKRKSFKIFH